MKRALCKHAPRAGKEDPGSATMAVVGVIAAIALALGGLAAGGKVLYAKAHVRSAADLSALAAARFMWNWGGDPCPLAQEVAQSNGAELSSCAVEGEDVMVTAVTETQVPFASKVSSEARAGPKPCG